MKTRSVKKHLMVVCSLVTSLSTVPILADWDIDQSYKAEEFYDNGKFGNFPPTDIDQKLLGHLNTAYTLWHGISPPRILSNTVSGVVAIPAF